MATFEAALEQLEAELEQWSARLEALVAQADEISPDARVDFGRRIDALRAKYRAARTAHARLKTADGEEASPDNEGGWNEVESAFFKAH